MGKRLEQYIARQERHTAKKHMKRSSVLLDIRKVCAEQWRFHTHWGG